jgi:diguanylate cyclase (GGDEF)-like protein
MVLGFGKMLESHECSPEQVRNIAGEIQRGAKHMASLLKDGLESAPARGAVAELGIGDDGEGAAAEAARLRRQLGQEQRRTASLEVELNAARSAQDQLQIYADDFRRTYADLRQVLRRMTVLYEVSTAIAATVEPDEVLDRAVSGLQRLLSTDAVAIYLMEQDQHVAMRTAFRWPEHLAAPPEEQEQDQSPLGRCLASGQTVLEGPGSAALAAPGSVWTLALPLSVRARQLGAVLVVRPREQPLLDEDRHLSGMVAAQVAMALENARLATTDGLTGLYNRRFFDRALAFECERARRVGRPVGLVIADIDHFKEFNDRFGHPAGDTILKAVAATLASQLRKTDIVARIGGEEFAAILPEDDLHGAAIVAERLRQAVARLPWREFDGKALPGARISLGVASLPPEHASPRVLVVMADDALRRAKATGRDRVCVVDPPASGEA